MMSLNFISKVILITLFSGILFACAGAARIDAMVPEDNNLHIADKNSKLLDNIALDIIDAPSDKNWSKVYVPQSLVDEKCANSGCRVTLGEVIVSPFLQQAVIYDADVDTDKYRNALLQSLQKYGLLAEKEADYLLEAELIKFETTGGIYSATRCEILYRLTTSENGKVLLEKKIGTTKEVSESEVHFVNERMKLTSEGAIRDNIKQIMMEIIKLQV